LVATDLVVPARQVRAVFDDRTLVVYQAYSPEIADRAVAAGIFVPPFSLDRMTWIKPSFLWMMYRSGWATKPGQERVLRVTITREGFEWALTHACLSHFDPSVYANHQEWEERKQATPVRVQWDPDRSLTLDPLPHRAIQVGLGGSAVRHYVRDWITDIADITPIVEEVRKLVDAGDLAEATGRLPAERPLPLSDPARQAVGAA
jgi:hypothetical protein